MSDQTTKISEKAGLPPGTLIYIGDKKDVEVSISVIDFNATEFNEIECKTTEGCFPFKDKKETISWIRVIGLHDTSIIGAIGNHYELHPLLQEEILNTRHRPKFEDFENYLFFTMKKLRIKRTKFILATEQISLVLSPNWLISFEESKSEIFSPLIKRMKENKERFHKRGLDYIFYRLIDITVDHYFTISERMSNATEKLEQNVLENPEQAVLLKIQGFKKMLLAFRKAVAPLREAIALLQKENTELIDNKNHRYFQDVYEHTIQIREFIEAQRDILSGLMDLYLSGVSNKMNQVMQVLTIMATIFIPLTFIAGIYGMNFDHMPELHWKYGYQLVWILMIAIFVGMVIYFRRKKWL